MSFVEPITGLRLPNDGDENAVTLLTAYLLQMAGVQTQGQSVITGYQLEWLSTTGIRIKPGSASVLSDTAGGTTGGGVLTSTANIDKTGLTIAASTWYHVYLYNSGTAASPVAAAEVVTTAPVNYFGTAYQKTSDATRRYLGSVRSNASSQLLKFAHYPSQGNRIRYQEHLAGTGFRILSGGSATSETSVSASGVIPVTSRLGDFRVTNTATNAAAIALGNADDNITIPASWLMTCAPNDDALGELPLSSSQAITYAYTIAPTGGLAYIDVAGYWFDR